MKKKLSAINYLSAVASRHAVALREGWLAKAGQLLATVTVLSLALATASGQTPAPIRKPRMTEPLEKPAMPPAYIYRLETGPRMISRFGLFTSFQVNVDADGNNILGDAANETSISVDPTNHNRMAIGWRQFDSVQSDFRQAGYGYTTDGGTTWTFPGVLQNNVFRSDPVTGSDETGDFFYLSLLVNTFCGDIWRSANGGQSWTEQSRPRLAWGMAFNTSFGPSSSPATSADSADPRMGGSLGRRL
jgi:hypothetical protein